ncbi:MAG: PAS domain S-box protein, partial [Planctomycetota bacterium]|nr:PAS domain S-box protein [Planctomycetota bacterium]
MSRAPTAPAASRGLNARSVLIAAAVAATLIVAGRASVMLTMIEERASLIWAPAGLAIAAILLFRSAGAAGAWVGLVVTQLLFWANPLFAVCSASAGALGAFVGSELLRRTLTDRRRISNVADAAFLAVLAALVSTLISSTVAVALESIESGLGWREAAIQWLLWYLGDAIGVLLFTPLALCWRDALERMAARWLEFGLIFSILTGASVMAFGLVESSRISGFSLVALPLAPLVWLSLRFGVSGAAFGSLVIAVVAAWTSSQGTAATLGLVSEELLISLWLVIGIVATTSIFLAAAMTERDEAVMRLTRSRAQYQGIIETAAEGVWMIDSDGRTTFANEPMAKMLGTTVDRMMGRPMYDFMDEGRKAEASSNMRRRAAGIAEQHDFLLRREDGGHVWTLMNTTPLHGADGEFSGALAMVTDITARKRTEEELRESEHRYRTIFDACTDAILIINEERRIVEVNRTACEMHGYSRSEFLQLSPGQFIASADLPKFREFCERLLAGQTYECEARDIRKDGSYIDIEVRGVPFVYHGKRAALGVVTDVTRRRQIERFGSFIREALETLARGRSANEALNLIATGVEARLEDAHCSVLRYDQENGCVHHIAAPSLPDSYTSAVDGAPVGPKAGSCGTALYRGQRVITDDIFSDPLWEEYREVIRPTGLRSCWSQPISSPGGQL